MRRLVKRLLKKYKYPPENQEDALNVVISQCEMWTDNVADFEDSYQKKSYDFDESFGQLKVAES